MALDHGRDPCPYVILNDFGGAFAMGVRPDLLRRPIRDPFDRNFQFPQSD